MSVVLVLDDFQWVTFLFGFTAYADDDLSFCFSDLRKGESGKEEKDGSTDYMPKIFFLGGFHFILCKIFHNIPKKMIFFMYILMCTFCLYISEGYVLPRPQRHGFFVFCVYVFHYLTLHTHDKDALHRCWFSLGFLAEICVKSNIFM